MAPVATNSMYRSKVIRPKAAPSWLARVNSRFFGVGIFVMIGLIFMALLHTWFEIQVVNLGYSINREMLKKEDLTQQIKLLSLEVAQLRSPNRIEAMAKNELGMQVAGKQQMIFLSQLGNGESGISIAQLSSGQVQSLDEVSNNDHVAKEEKTTTLAQTKTKTSVAKNSQSVNKADKKPVVKPAGKEKPAVLLAKAPVKKAPVVATSKVTPKPGVQVLAKNKTKVPAANKNSDIKIADSTKPKINKTVAKPIETKRVVPAVIIGR